MKTKLLLTLFASAALACSALAAPAAHSAGDAAFSEHAPPVDLKSFELTATPEFRAPALELRAVSAFHPDASDLVVKLVCPAPLASEATDSLVARPPKGRMRLIVSAGSFQLFQADYARRDLRSHEPAAG